MEPVTPCLFVARDQPRAVRGRHTDDCGSASCKGCWPCGQPHCVGRPVRMADLVSPADVAAATGIRTVQATEGRAPRAGVSACTGEQRMADPLPDGATVLAGHFSGHLSGHLSGRSRGTRVEVAEVRGTSAADVAGVAAAVGRRLG